MMQGKHVVVGVDGGGTKTRAVVVGLDGSVLGWATGPTSNFQVVGAERMAQVVGDCVRKAVAKAGSEAFRIRRLWAGLAGVGRPSDRQQAHEALRSLGIADTYQVDSDAMAALGGAFAGGEGIIVIAGTGTICLGKGADGRVERSGGWGYLLGDEGSGYFFGQQAIVASLKDLDGRGPRTRLRQEIEKRYNLERIDRIIPLIYQGKLNRTEIASLAPLVFEVAASGDRVAQEIVRRGGEELGKLAAAVARRLNWSDDSVRIAPIGSVFRQRKALQPHMEKELEAAGVRFRFVEPMFDPALGAAILGLQDEGVEIEERLVERLRETGRDAENGNG